MRVLHLSIPSKPQHLSMAQTHQTTGYVVPPMVRRLSNFHAADESIGMRSVAGCGHPAMGRGRDGHWVELPWTCKPARRPRVTEAGVPRPAMRGMLGGCAQCAAAMHRPPEQSGIVRRTFAPGGGRTCRSGLASDTAGSQGLGSPRASLRQESVAGRPPARPRTLEFRRFMKSCFSR